MFLKNNLLILVVIIFLFGCAEKGKEQTVLEKTPFENVLSETEMFVSFVKKGNISIDSSSINSFIVLYNLTQEDALFRSNTKFKSIQLNRVFKCQDSTINAVHFDFYYDSLNQNLSKNTDSLLNYLEHKLGSFEKTLANNSIKTYTWFINQNILDFEIFKSGYTFTLRKKPKTITPVKDEKELAVHVPLIKDLLALISNNTIKLGASSKTILTSFKETFKEKTNALVFTKTYDQKILLSASFTFKNEGLSGLYFDYIYADSTTTKIVADAKEIKSFIRDIFGEPQEIATVAISTYFEWDNVPIKLEIYSNGFSIVMEQKEV